jgi:VWFA-related protein
METTVTVRRTPIIQTLAVAALLASAVWSQKPVQTFSETAEVIAVEVPVQVLLDGKPVRGLTVDNFEIFEGRSRQAITSFETVDLVAPAAASQQAQPEVAASPAVRRHFLMLFDLGNSEPSAIVRARQAVKELVATGLHPSDRVAVATYTPSKGPQLVLSFTSDRAQIETALDTLGVPELLDRSPDPLRLVLSATEADLGSRPESGAGSRGAEVRAERDAEVLETMRQTAQQSEKATRENQVSRVMALTRSFADLARVMSSVRGRKHVVYLSEGFDSRLLVGAEADQETTSATESGEFWEVDSEAKFGSSRVQNDMEKMLEQFRRADCVIQSVDIGGLRAEGGERARASGIEALLVMAKDTGGELFQNYNNLSQAMDNVLDRTSVTYLLTFQPEVKADGEYRRLNVKLKNAPKGARLVHRPGYYAPKPLRQTSSTELQLTTAQTVLGGQEGGQLDLAVLAAPFRSAGAKSYVPVVIEIGAASLFAGHPGDLLSTEVYVYALDEHGQVADYLVQNVGFDLKKAPPALRQTGFKFFGHADLAPGTYDLRVFVRNGQTGGSALRVARVEVPAANAPALLPPFFPEAPGRWMVTRETVESGTPTVAYPFMLGETPYVPAARAVVPASGQAQMAMVVYNLPAGVELRVEAEVSTLDGKRVGAGMVSGLTRAKADAPGVERLSAMFKPQGLAPGLYSLRLNADYPGGKLQSAPVIVEISKL